MAEKLTCKVDNQGRIMLPAKWRKLHHIQPESELRVELRDNCLVLQTREQGVREAQEMVRRLIPQGKSLVNDLLKQRRREALEERAPAARVSADSRSSRKRAKAGSASRSKRRQARG
jgi:AbrB family looped-hinge helix DNA binding protein